MTSWAVLVGTLVAALIAWLAIAGVALLGEGQLRTRPIRWLGAAALGVLALSIAGLPIPWWASPSLLGVGLLAGLTPLPAALGGA